MKRTLAMLLAVMFVMTGFGLTTVFSGLIAGAEFYDYFIYTQITGFHDFTDEELSKFTSVHSSKPVNGTVGDMPVIQWELTSPNEWGTYELGLLYGRNLNEGNHNDSSKTTLSVVDSACDTVNGKTVMGDLSFKGQNGISFWVGRNGQNFNGKVLVYVKKVPCAGPFFTGALDDHDPMGSTADELNEGGLGFSYESIFKTPDEDGYVHFDFKTDFRQVDWWSVDDEGINRSVYGDVDGDGVENGSDYLWPIPKSKIPDISGFMFKIQDADPSDVITIGDVNMYRDSRIYIDELDEVLMNFEALNPEEYTEESYTEATEVYLEAYEMYYDPDLEIKYTQENIDDAVEALKKAIKALKPLFQKPSETVVINGFEGLTDDDMDLIMNGGVSIDAAYVTDEFLPGSADCDQSIGVIGGAVAEPPYYGWSNFQTAIYGDDGESIVAVGNVFGAENLDEAAGLRFWFKPADTYDPAPTSMIIGVGSSGMGAYFETEEDAVTLPEGEGYVYVPWSKLYDFNEEYDIYEVINELDYISVKIYDCAQQTYYISDLHAFDWSLQPANFDEMDAKIVDATAYLATLKKSDWSIRSWQRVEQAIAEARALHDEYGATQKMADEATENIDYALRRLTKAGDTATEEEINALENLFYAAKDYWRGNYTASSYLQLKLVIDEVTPKIEDEFSSEECQGYITRIEAAIKGLVRITHTSLVTSIYSFETMSSRDFTRSNGHRVEGIDYSLVTAANAGIALPEGYAKALKMVSTMARSTKTTDQHGNFQFKTMDSYGGATKADIDDPKNEGNKIGGTMGDLTGTAGIRIWVGVNDVSLVRNLTFRFGVSNCAEGPLFEKHCVDIPFPSTGSGWLYLPWEYFEYYDEWTKGEMINLLETRFYIVRADGEAPAGLEMYVTGIAAYTDFTATEHETPVISNISEGDIIDASAGAIVPQWNVGSAQLNGKRFNYGDKITVNGDYTLIVTNANKSTSVTFKVIGGQDPTPAPIVTGVKDGEVYDQEVTIKWDIGTATLNGVEFTNGGVVSEAGSYQLVVTNNDKSVTIRFVIEGEEEPPVKKGDFDGDGKITVSDALAALRIAAKMVEETADDIAIGDIDKDNKITVSDSLAILRVAAKMAGEDTL